MRAFSLFLWALAAASPQDHEPTKPPLTIAEKYELKSHFRYHAYLVTLDWSYVHNSFEPAVDEFVFNELKVLKFSEAPKPADAFIPHRTTIQVLHLKVEYGVQFRYDRPYPFTVLDTGAMGDFLLTIWDSEEDLVVWPPTQRGGAY